MSINNIIDWFKQSNRYKHLLGGIILGFIPNSYFTAVYVGVTVGAALEYKDKAWGGEADPIDFSLTVIGTVIGQLIKQLILLWVK